MTDITAEQATTPHDPRLTAYEAGRWYGLNGQPYPAGATRECVRGWWRGRGARVTGGAREVLISRSGDAPLRLIDYGLVAQSSSRDQQGPRQNRWHELELWADDTRPAGPEQPHCVVIRYCTLWEGELDHAWAEIVPRREIAARLRTYDPLARLVGYPPGEEKQRRLELALRAGWEDAVSDLLEQAEVWELADD